jgi:hypothetical protein
MANFWRVLEFDKFAGEWPLLSFCPNPWKSELLSYKIKRRRICALIFIPTEEMKILKILLNTTFSWQRFSNRD